MRRTGTAMLPIAGLALAAALAMLLWGLSSARPPAAANPALTVGLDMQPSTSTDSNGDGVFESIPGTALLEKCRDVAVGSEVQVALFGLDMVNLIAFDADLEYDGSIVRITGAFTGTTPSNPNGTLFMSAQLNSDVMNVSQNDPNPNNGAIKGYDSDGDTLVDEDPIGGGDNDGDGLIDEDPRDDRDGLYEVSAAETGVISGDTGSGFLARITIEGAAKGVSQLSLSNLDFNNDGVFDTGVHLGNSSGNSLGDPDGDGWFNSPFINQFSTIAVGQQDSDGDGTSNTCDPDDDNDGVLDDGDGSGVAGDNPCTGGATTNCDDNCPLNSNAGQQDLDGDRVGDACDMDTDGDGHWNAKETKDGSSTTNPNSKPEVCNGIDDDGDTQVDEGWGSPLVTFDFNGNTIPDCTEPGLDTDGDGINNTSDNDDDGDANGTAPPGTDPRFNDIFSDAQEVWMGLDSLSPCATIVGQHDALAPDVDNSRTVNVLDVGAFRSSFFTRLGDPGYNRRVDMNGDGSVNVLDVGALRPFFFKSCTPVP